MAVLDSARNHRSESLVLVGAPGVGKSALLAYAAEQASDFRVLRAAGAEFEMELALAGLQQLCAPLLEHRGALPAPQRRSLDTAFGREHGTTDGFVLGLAVLSLLAEASVSGPLVCIVDDAQWLDQQSGQTLRFVARRLLAEPVALIFASRDVSDGQPLSGLPSLAVSGLDRGDSATLLDSAIMGRLDERVRDRIIAEAGGNPLALLELPRSGSVTTLAGGYEVPVATPLVDRMESSFRARMAELPDDTKQFLTTAAADPLGDVAVLWRALARQDLDAESAAPAEEADLVALDSHVRFRHPLVRSVAYRAASPAGRRAAHHALSESIDEADGDRRAWHRAQAESGPNEGVAIELVGSAGRARARGGFAAAAAFLERASALSADPRARGERALAAAQAKFEAGAHESAIGLLATAEASPIDAMARARVLLLRAQIEFALRRGSDAPSMLLDAATRLGAYDRSLARDAHLEAIGAAMFVGRLADADAVRVAAEAARAAIRPTGPECPADLLLEALTVRWTLGYEAGVVPIREAITAFRRQAAEGNRDLLPWLWLACPVLPGPFGPELWDDAAWHEMATVSVELARQSGALAVLPTALMYRAGVSIFMGRLEEAGALLEESEAISQATGLAPGQYATLLLMAWRGQEQEALEVIESQVRDARERGEGRVLGLASQASAVLFNGLGRYESALTAAKEAVEYDDMGFYGWSLAELVEAAVRSGATADAKAAMAELDPMTLAAETDWALGVRARSLALMSAGPEAESLHQEAIDRLGRTTVLAHLARAELVYGEWLRREGRRADARGHLRVAHETFSTMGAEAFAERARRELMATGESVRKRAAGTAEGLTAQEEQIALLAADGRTNPEIAARLFISPRTVEYHMSKVLRKLNISSRRELRDGLGVRSAEGDSFGGPV